MQHDGIWKLGPLYLPEQLFQTLAFIQAGHRQRGDSDKVLVS